MNSERWDRIQTLFHQAANLPKSAQRDYLRGTGSDDELIAIVIAMLEGDALDSPLDGGLAGYAAHYSGTAAFPEQIGPYRLDKLLGQGGMGIVYLAHRDDLNIPVAIKFLADAWLSPMRAQRFAAEQKTLAQMNHPFIAKIYDAHTLRDGTPWFAMEYVEGQPITEYCSQHCCSVWQRLLLMRWVAEAVQYSHSRAVIHRDLKPSNILVKADGKPRLLDFGIAKHLEAAQPSADQTRPEQHLFTPAYAAPEQMRGEATGVFTDIYALGVITYELLYGSLPGSKVQPTQAHASPADWADLNVLCSTAMHPEIERRYRSAEAYVHDIDHFLNQQPLEARRDTFRYRAGKFLIRNRRGLRASTAAFAAMACITGYLLVKASEARHASARAAARTERVQRFMLDLFNGGDQSAGPARDLRVVTLVDRGVKQAQSLHNEPPVQAALYRTLGTVYQQLGKLDRADALLQSALAIHRHAGSEGEIADSLAALGLLRVEQAKLQEAEALIREACQIARTATPKDRSVLAATNAALAKVLAAKSQYTEAIPLLENAIRLQPPQLSSELPAMLRQLAGVHFFLGHYDLCDSLTKRAMNMHIQLVGDQHPLVADDLIDIGNVQHQRGMYADAERTLRHALAIYLSWYGEIHPETASTLVIISQQITAQHRNQDAEQLLERALGIQRSIYGPLHPRVAFVINEMATSALIDNRLDEAQQRYTQVFRIYSSALGENSSQSILALANLGSVYLRRKEYARAETVFRDVVARDTATLSAEHFNTCVAQIKLGRTLVKQNRFAEAVLHSLAGYTALSKQTDSSSSWLLAARQDLAACYRALNQPERARTYELARR